MAIGQDIIDVMRSGELVDLSKPEFSVIWHFVNRTLSLIPELNSSTNTDQIRQKLIDIIGKEIDASTTIFAPFYTNFGRFIFIGKNVFINHGCSFLDLGGITIEDDVLIGPKVNIITENHPLNPALRKNLICNPVLIKQNAWIGAGSTILPGVTIGVNSVVAAGSVVTKDVPDNTIFGGVPAKLIKNLEEF